MHIRTYFWPLTLIFVGFLSSCGTVIQAPPSTGGCAAGVMATPDGPSVDLSAGSEVMIGFYNVENLFDTVNAPYEGDDWLLVSDKINWEEGNYFKKLDNLSRAIASIGNGGPDVLGIAEVENACVLADLVQTGELAKKGYKVVHEESPDRRGIDVALIYDPQKFEFQVFQTFEVDFKSDPQYVSREILTVKGLINEMEVYLLVNHWPSRGGGQEKSEPRRLDAAATASDIVAQIREASPDAGIILMGDFNDDPSNESLRNELGAAPLRNPSLTDPGLYNAMYDLHDPESEGSLTYRGKYNLFDQIILNEKLLGSQTVSYIPNSATIHHPNFMRFRGKGPSRAIHKGEFKPYGFSDHFPVYVKLEVK